MAKYKITQFWENTKIFRKLLSRFGVKSKMLKGSTDSIFAVITLL